MIRRPPRSTRTDTLFPYTTLFRANYSHLRGVYRYGPAEINNVTVFGPGSGRDGQINPFYMAPAGDPTAVREDRKSVGEGKSVSVRVDLGGRRIIKKKIRHKTSNTLIRKELKHSKKQIIRR